MVDDLLREPKVLVNGCNMNAPDDVATTPAATTSALRVSEAFMASSACSSLCMSLMCAVTVVLWII